jgi:rubrerythrin
MSIEDVLREMRHPDYGSIASRRWADAIEAAMREKDAEIERLREALEIIASGKLPRCPFEDPRCEITTDQLCPVCGDSSDINAESKCTSVTGNYQDIARAALAGKDS